MQLHSSIILLLDRLTLQRRVYEMCCIWLSLAGPDYWGTVNQEWRLCKKGLLQSPIDIHTDQLLFDASLRHVHVSKHRVHHDVTSSIIAVFNILLRVHVQDVVKDTTSLVLAN